jgi:polypeptide N-acetylgalactosaminyltransferase
LVSCKDVKWYSPLPSSSVIVIFHNEAWSVLLRTVHSILDRTEPNLLNEIIIVDDFSNFRKYYNSSNALIRRYYFLFCLKAHLGEPLEKYIKTLDKVKLVRTSKREGLIRARLIGAAKATGEILIFLDSHCECADGWLGIYN